MLVIATQWEGYSAVEAWALVKALVQFGRFTGLAATTTRADAHFGFGGIPTYDFTHARYSSRMVTLHYIVTRDRNGARVHPLTQSQQKLFHKYLNGSHGPLIVIGAYVREGTQLSPGELDLSSGAGMSFTTVQAALQHHATSQMYVPEINAEANVLVALICRADGKRPGSVCSHGAVAQLLKHIRSQARWPP